MTAMDFDFCWVPRGGIADTVRMASLGESLGYRTFWIPDQDFEHDPFVLATAVAEATRHLGIGIGITSPLIRHAVHIARGAASLHDVSGGRFRLGLGSGNIAHVVRPMGVSPKGSVQRLREGAHAVTALLHGRSVTFAEGQPEIRLGMEVEGDIPVYLGARGPRTIQVAGELADGILVESLFNGDGMTYVAENLERGAASGQGDRSTAAMDVVAWQTVAVSDDVSVDLDRFRPWVARMMQIGPLEALTRIGIDPDNIEQVVTLLTAGRTDEAAAAVTDASARSIVLIGSATEVIDQIRHAHSLGATSVAVVSTAPYADAAANLARVAQEVMPAFDAHRSRR